MIVEHDYIDPIGDAWDIHRICDLWGGDDVWTAESRVYETTLEGASRREIERRIAAQAVAHAKMRREIADEAREERAR